MSDNNRYNNQFIIAINNGWLNLPKVSIDKIMNTAYVLILSEKNSSEIIKIFHAQEAKTYIESITSHGIEIEIIQNTVCSEVKVIVNLDYDKISSADYCEIKRKVKSYLG